MPATGPTTQITIPEKTELKHPKVGSMLDDLIARVEAGEVSAEDAAQEAPVQDGDSVAVTIDLSPRPCQRQLKDQPRPCLRLVQLPRSPSRKRPS